MFMTPINSKLVYLCTNFILITFGVLPKPFDDFFTERSDINNYHTKNNGDYNQTKNRKLFTDQAVRTTGPILWNVLNDHIKNVISIKQFRIKRTSNNHWSQLTVSLFTSKTCVMVSYILICIFFFFTGEWSPLVLLAFRPFPSIISCHNIYLYDYRYVIMIMENKEFELNWTCYSGIMEHFEMCGWKMTP